jgi:hypothetical protein
MQDFEKLGVFYLGRTVSPDTKKSTGTPLLYDSKDLVTHAVCVGMTGSGKTGLCIGVLEEAAIDGIPALAIDPKGDIANLLLTFPDLQPSDFRPWINEDEARSKGQSPDEFAAKQAELWSKGLASFAQDGSRIQKLKDAVDVAIYTPGSEAGLPVSILKSFAAPPAAILQDSEALRDRIGAATGSLLTLLGITADPIQSREYALLANIFESNWRARNDLDLAALITQIQSPPFQKFGVLDLETFYPAKERFALAMSLNNLLASPGFSSWLSGEPLDIDSLLYSREGKPRICILSIAHLSDQERMFFVSLLLNQVLSWVRTQPGTTSLRALLYMDEIFGYFPPVANPPSKKPLLTLLKQARAFGLGLVLATQNPVDLDYKGLSNTGTWFIGRLQTERDKMRVMEGLEGAAAESHTGFDRQTMEQLLASLGNRIFLMNNVHEDHPQLFETRWTLSYLRGPLTKEQIRLLTGNRTAAAGAASETTQNAAPSPHLESLVEHAPVLPPEIPCYFLPAESAGNLRYTPVLAGAAKLHYVDTKANVDLVETLFVIAPLGEGAAAVDWSASTPLSIELDELEKQPQPGARFDALPAAAAKAKNYAAWTKSFGNWVFQSQQLALLKSPSLGRFSKPGETERDFRIRLQQEAREERDRISDELKRKYTPRFAALAERKRRAELAREQQKSQQNQAMLETAVSVGAGLLGAFLGRKTISATGLSKAASTARQAGRSWKEMQDVAQANETVEQLAQQSAEMQSQFEAQLAVQQARADPMREQFKQVPVRLKKANIEVQLVALAWKPVALASAAV